MTSLAFVVISLCIIGGLSHPVIDESLLKPATRHLANLIRLGEDNKAPFDKYVQSKGYAFEQHSINTKDGYVLKYYRIQSKGQKGMQSKPVVYLQHGLLDSADCWILNGDKSPAFILANQGFDVWLGNSRGNKYSRNHNWLNPNKDAAFWQFTWQHMAAQDLPAAFSYIRGKTNRKINYIGHSQGTLIMFAALAEQIHEVTSNLGTYIALAPICHMHHMKSNLFRAVANTPLAPTLLGMGINEFLAPNWMSTRIQPTLCKYLPGACKNAITMVTDLDGSNDDKSRYPFLMGHFPSGTSTLDLSHFRQMVNNPSLNLLKYDFGLKKNYEVYKQATPPAYNLGNIWQKVYLFVGATDRLAIPEDVRELQQTVRNTEYREFPLGHMSFMIAKDMQYLWDIIGIIRQNGH